MTVERSSFDRLEESIHFFFKEKSLLKQSLTHSSALKKRSGIIINNERLEFLGDAVLKLVMSNYLYQKFSNYDEGELSKLRAYFVSDLFISKLAKLINLGSYIVFSKAEQRSGASERNSILANAFEALLGACFLDKGLSATKDMFFNLFNQISIDYSESIDYKSQLQELCQKNKDDLPLYTIVKQSGPEHQKEFFVKVKVSFKDNIIFAQGSAYTKKNAEQYAAKQVLTIINRV